MGTYFILFAYLLVLLAFFIPKICFVKVSGHGIAIGFNENTYGKGVCILVRAYAPVNEWYPDINIDGIRVLTDYANRDMKKC